MANIGIIPYEEKGDIGNKKPEDLSKCKIVKKGDFVINSMNYGIGSYGVSSYDGVCSPVYIVLITREAVVEPGFAFRIFEDKRFQGLAQSFGNGILAHRCAIGWDILKVIGVGVPPRPEQKQILEFLDRETAKIDALIAEQQRLIELLQEKRQAVISHAVTKGLNPDAPMKDSGVEWLGEVPEHWIIGKLCYYTSLDTGSTPDRQRPEYWNGDISWVKTGEVRYEDIHETEENITELALRETACSLHQPGTLLMALYGQGVTRGRVGMLMTAASCNQACAAISPSPSIIGRYLEIYLANAYSHLRSLGNETTQQNLNLDFVGKLELLVPPLAEQECIWQTTKQRTKELDSLLLRSADAIVLLQERRSALISAAVTGQIDVRGMVPEAEAA
jgi:type I restriction enzyme S subunit